MATLHHRVRPWSRWSAYAAAGLVVLLVESPYAVAGSLRGSPYMRAVCVVLAAFETAMLLDAARRRRQLAELAQGLSLYAGRHPPTAAGWRALLTVVVLSVAYLVVTTEVQLQFVMKVTLNSATIFGLQYHRVIASCFKCNDSSSQFFVLKV